ncbi:histidine phosphatase family protein [Streptomyces sp. NPDC054770]
MAQLFFARHGETANNAARTLSTAPPGPSLNESGLQQSRALSQALAAAPLAAVYCSPLTRARETAAEVAGPRSLKPHVLPELRELSVGTLEGRFDDAVFAQLESVYLLWAEHERLDIPAGPEGETGAAVLERFRAAVLRIAERDEAALVVSHGGVLQFALPYLCANLPNNHGIVNWLRNCELVEASVDGDRIECVSWAGTRADDLRAAG